MLQKEYVINGNNLTQYPCVIRVDYGKKGHYVIAKCKAAPATVRAMENSLNAFIRGGKNNPSGFWFHLFNFVKAHPDGKFKVKTLMESESGYECLVREQEEIDKGKNNPLFLNNTTKAYVPAWDEEKGLWGWLTPNDIMLFGKWVKAKKKSAKNKKPKANAK